jgi:hypothetical protein
MKEPIRKNVDQPRQKRQVSTTIQDQNQTTADQPDSMETVADKTKSG